MGIKKTYPVYVLWLCAKKGGKLLLYNYPLTETVLPAAELLTTYSYSPATRRVTLRGQANVYGLVRCPTHRATYAAVRTFAAVRSLHAHAHARKLTNGNIRCCTLASVLCWMAASRGACCGVSRLLAEGLHLFGPF
jgi:hypothetical protein